MDSNPYAVLDPENKKKASKVEENIPSIIPQSIPHHESNLKTHTINEEIKVDKESIKAQHIGKHPHEEQKPKGVPAEPHPLDRHSGTGRGKEVSKGGAGKHNWGSLEDELKYQEQDAQLDEENEEYFEKNPESSKKQMTLNEYKHKQEQPVEHHPKVPLVGAHSEVLGFKSEEEPKNEQKHEEKHQKNSVECTEKEFPKLG